MRQNCKLQHISYVQIFIKKKICLAELLLASTHGLFFIQVAICISREQCYCCIITDWFTCTVSHTTR